METHGSMGRSLLLLLLGSPVAVVAASTAATDATCVARWKAEAEAPCSAADVSSCDSACAKKSLAWAAACGGSTNAVLVESRREQADKTMEVDQQMMAAVFASSEVVKACKPEPPAEAKKVAKVAPPDSLAGPVALLSVLVVATLLMLLGDVLLPRYSPRYRRFKRSRERSRSSRGSSRKSSRRRDMKVELEEQHSDDGEGGEGGDGGATGEGEALAPADNV